ncbi:hypothetical protein ACSQ43_001864 [Pseudomonas aeruginosa]|uniref:hypothetical protein n=1 Tax=Pseudomonas aeruginosa TaxID=287 RepID=UPI0018C5DF41|nr:hypothetical protein [Pseudomonas aeruginosa]EIU4871604.1 hypothetical protein [Pseudomonas aeruginosa]MBG5624069.1 hypothetical protein [Pseudomonas aeruginosa]MBI8070629.1 hypothetical protein [Pseudomonas aeruginosa]
MTNELTDVRCHCGTEFPAESYDAGFIAGSGMCQNCDAALPPKDICTCPSGDGSLRHPCPAHPAVEQAGGDERAAFEAWLAQAMSKKFEPEFDLAKYEDSSEYRYSPAAAYWKAWQARAALAQPSPASDLDPFNLAPHAEAFNEAPAEALKSDQAEAERPEADPHIPAQTIAEAAIEQLIKSGAEHYEEFHFDVHIDGHEGERPVVVTVAFSDGPSAHELRMKAEQQRDAALARVAELEKQEPVAHLRASDLERLNQPGIAGSAGSLWNGPREGFVPLYAAPVAQAQHSVPETTNEEANSFLRVADAGQFKDNAAAVRTAAMIIRGLLHRPAIMKSIIRHRIGLTPEYEGQWHAGMYGEDGEVQHHAEADTPDEAVRAVVALAAAPGKEGV